jgi:transcriptional regulator with XRE-family HTH domain
MKGSAMDELAIALGLNIRKHRLACGLTQEELSDRAGIHYTFLGHIERGGKLPSLPTLARVADALGTTLSDILKGA